MSHPFQFDNVKTYLPIFQRNTAKVLAKIKENEEFELTAWTAKLALENLGIFILLSLPLLKERGRGERGKINLKKVI
jgi:hypothetical protein